MNTVQVSLLVFGLVLVFGTYSGVALKCYVCNSADKYEGDACNDKELMEPFLIDCAEFAEKYVRPEMVNATKCRKQTQTVEDSTRVVRTCAIEGRLDRCVERTGTKEVKVKYCECEGDGCNTGSAIIASVVTVSIAAVLSRLSFH